jgi:RNA recognition motif-containing protein
MVKLFVVGFPRGMSEIELDQLFTKEAIIKRVTIIRDMQTGISEGYAFVEMMDQAGADRAVRALHGITMGDRTMSVRLAEDKAVGSFGVEKFLEPNQRAAEPRRHERNVNGKRPRKPRS